MSVINKIAHANCQVWKSGLSHKGRKYYSAWKQHLLHIKYNTDISDYKNNMYNIKIFHKNNCDME